MRIYETVSGPSTDANMLTTTIKDVLIQMNLSFNKLRGQDYNGARAMSRAKCGVAKQIRDFEPQAVYTHCCGHALNLVAADTLKQCKVMKDSRTREITKLIKYSPYSSTSRKLHTESTVGIRILCQTRWTEQSESISSIIVNYKTLESTWEEASQHAVIQKPRPGSRMLQHLRTQSKNLWLHS